MAFLLRQISTSADGREIVRTSKIEGDRLTVGRDPASDVHLTDLAVALHHAAVERDGPDRLVVTTGEGLFVELNGRKVSSAAVERSAGGDIRIASHLLRILPASPDDAETAIDARRVAEDSSGYDRADEGRFSLASILPSKRAAAWTMGLLVLALFLAWPIKTFYDRQGDEARAATAASFHPDSMWSPGKLSLVHTQLESDCQACHVKPFEAVRDASCTSCHTKIHDHADPFRLARAQPDLSRWGRIELAFKETFNLPPGRCVECHTEHEGPQEMPVTAQRFCSDCHGGLKDKLPDTKLGNAGDFGTSHPEFQPAVLTNWSGNRPVLERVSLDARPREDSGLKFPHAMHLSKTNGVAQMARRLSGDFGFGQSLDCKDCHDPTPDGVRFQAVNMEEDCSMCHSLAFDRQGGTLRTLRHGEPGQVIADLRDFYRARPAGAAASLGGMARRPPGDGALANSRIRFTAASHAPGQAERAIRAVFSPGGACYDCHQVVAPGGNSLDYRIRPVAFPIRYMHKGWFDHKPHATEDCATCHAASTSNAASDLLLPDLKTCRTCHGGETATKAKVPSSCATCHDYHQDAGQPAMLVRQRVRGKKRDTVVAAAAGVGVNQPEAGNKVRAAAGNR